MTTVFVIGALVAGIGAAAANPYLICKQVVGAQDCVEINQYCARPKDLRSEYEMVYSKVSPAMATKRLPSRTLCPGYEISVPRGKGFFCIEEHLDEACLLAALYQRAKVSCVRR